MGVIEGALVADLYAGSGAMGIEALSRGAAHCTFIENDRAALRVLNDNVANLGLNPVTCLLYTSPSPRDVEESRMPSSA